MNSRFTDRTSQLTSAVFKSSRGVWKVGGGGGGGKKFMLTGALVTGPSITVSVVGIPSDRGLTMSSKFFLLPPTLKAQHV